MKRLANLKSSSSDSANGSSKKAQSAPQGKPKKSQAKNNPYPESGHFNGNANGNGQLSFSSPVTPRSHESITSQDNGSGPRQTLDKSNKSTAATVATHPDTVHSTRSKADTGNSNTAGGGSTFSSPNHSEQSLTTTLTTIQSSAPSNVLNQNNQNPQASAAPPVQFSHQYPTSPPPSALPPHLAPQQQPHPTSYQAATANNILTDNASILTLASSSKRRRRNSLDTNASVRALAPSSVWGGSRESLPLSVLSGNADAIYSPPNRPGGPFSNTERASVYSASGVTAPALSSERNSYYKNADGLSVRSGLLGHGRTDSIGAGSIGPVAASPLASPRDPVMSGRLLSRRSGEWKDPIEGHDIEDDVETRDTPNSTVNDGKGKSSQRL
jgi:hypothetical protein